MAEPIANDWKAIRDRMQQIKSEESASQQPCSGCKGRGWIPAYGRLGSYTACVYNLCHNPRDLPSPDHRGAHGSRYEWLDR
jgi:hypothetical protein